MTAREASLHTRNQLLVLQPNRFSLLQCGTVEDNVATIKSLPAVSLVDIVEDPMLALIVRFAGAGRDASLPNESFLRDQVVAMQGYLNQFPASEKNTRAIEWIEEHAGEYRKSWQLKQVSSWVRDQRCPDCPLQGGQMGGSCEIHGRWLGLLNQYAADEITVGEYVEKALVLLNRHKNRLRKAEFLPVDD